MAQSAEQVTAVRQFSCVKFMDKIGRYLAPLLLMAADYIAVVAALSVTLYMRNTILLYNLPSLVSYQVNHVYIYFIIPLVYLMFFIYDGIYHRRIPFWNIVEKIFKICAFVTIMAVGLVYFTGQSQHVSRLYVGLSFISCFLFLTLEAYVVRRMLVVCGLWDKPVIIVGAGKTAELLARSFAEESCIGYKIAGLIEDCCAERPLTRQFPLLGNFNNIEETILASGVDNVILATPGLEREQLVSLVYRVQPHVRSLAIIPNLFGIPLSNMEVETFLKEKIVLLKVRNNLSSIVNLMVKRSFDLVVSVLILPFLLLLMSVIAVVIKMDSKGPVFHLAKRLGKNGDEFICYKFRTMHVNSDMILEKHLADDSDASQEWQQFAKLRGYDPRVTATGKWLRKFSLDELPQILNVLKGDMSLVGPRPYLPREKQQMKYYINTILQTLPGITGFWQVSGRNEIDFDGRLQMDAWYVRNWSVWLDMILLIKTVKVIFSGKGAY
ncbi:bacterial sugar transferase [Lucifera butyrica]|uniref:Bacterial sugar transferase n=1 Tax=Lucifera butyrica TaxID=1351585 RepID=A0A498RES5_9FIRM|nr:undecaprenyl-phosphate galactose phosphotransferase WbaP [Lucifera butyrica]VBB09310.1 bacterial sugar transferase [Lucifera butyrica]